MLLRFCSLTLLALCGAQAEIPRPAPQLFDPIILATATDNVQDLLGLSALYKSTGGENTWYYKYRWMSDDPDCTWFGVTCNSFGSVDSLRLDSNRLNGTLPTQIGLMTAMESMFSFGYNSITGTLPTQIGLMTAMESHFYLPSNSITGTLPTQIGNWDFLTVKCPVSAPNGDWPIDNTPRHLHLQQFNQQHDSDPNWRNDRSDEGILSIEFLAGVHSNSDWFAAEAHIFSAGQ